MLIDSPSFLGPYTQSSDSAINNVFTVAVANASPYLDEIKVSRGTVASPALVALSDIPYSLSIKCHDGVSYKRVAGFDVTISAAPGANDLPSTTTFYAVADGSGTANPVASFTSAGLSSAFACSFSGQGGFGGLYVSGSSAVHFYVQTIQAHAGIYNYADQLIVGDTTFFYGTANAQTLTVSAASHLGLTYAADKISYSTSATGAATTTLTSFARTLIDDVDASTARSTLGLAIGTNVQAYDAELAALAGLVSAANKVPYFTGSGTAALTDFSVLAQSLVNQTTTGAMQSTLALVIGTNVQAYDAELAAIAGLTSAADACPYFTGSGTAAVMTVTAAARTLLDDTTVANMVTTLGGAAATGTAGTGLVYKTSPTLTTPNLGVATATSINLSSQAIASLNWNTYTPTVANLANIAVLGTPVGVYCRLGDMIHVIVTVNIDATTSGAFTSMKCTLPIATDLTNGFHLAGFMNGGTSGAESGYCYADTANDWAVCNFFPATAAAQDVRIMFSYKF